MSSWPVLQIFIFRPYTGFIGTPLGTVCGRPYGSGLHEGDSSRTSIRLASSAKTHHGCRTNNHACQRRCTWQRSHHPSGAAASAPENCASKLLVRASCPLHRRVDHRRVIQRDGGRGRRKHHLPVWVRRGLPEHLRRSPVRGPGRSRVSTLVTCDSICLLGASKSTVRLEYVAESLENVIGYHLHLRSMPLPYEPGLPTGSCLWTRQTAQ